MPDAPAIRKSTINNFDLIRLFAALQVAVTHSAAHLSVPSKVSAILGYFPGVPIFFFVSGYLIFQSYANIKDNRLKPFFTNRVLRLYPALYFCFFLTLGSLYLTGYLQSQSFTVTEFAIWAFTSLTFFQFYNPDFLRSYGVGAVNGSLWTIAVELQFYILTPLLSFMLKSYKRTTIGLFMLLVVANIVNTLLDDSLFSTKLLGVSFVPWFYMFIVGAYVSTNRELQSKILSVNPLIYLAAYLVSYEVAASYKLGSGNEINPVSYLLLGCLVLTLAFTLPRLSTDILSGNDVSYGVYIFHMPIVNLLLFIGIQGTFASFSTALLGTLAVAAASWFAIEKPSLRLKKVALRKYS